MNDDIILDIDEAADLLKMSRRSLDTLVRAGKIPATKLVNQWLFSRHELMVFIGNMCKANVEAVEPDFPELKKTPLSRRRKSCLSD